MYFSLIYTCLLYTSGTAKGQELHRIAGLSHLLTEEPGAHSQRKFRHADAAPLGQQKMTKLMEQHNQAEYQKRKYDFQLTTCFR